MEKENWKDVPGFNGRYSVSDMGRVKGAKGLISTYISNRGYVRLKLYQAREKGVKRVTHNFYLHRLVAKAFVGNPNGLGTVNHISFDKKDNRASNLEWMTLQDNIQHYYSHKKLF